MSCASCGFANRDDARFCGECGAPIETHCGACGRANPPARKFCDGCGASLAKSAGTAAPAPRSYTPRHLAEKILQTKSALEGESKQVTVLFADVKGSMELAEQVDAEEWHGILDRFFQILADGVHRFEGTVNQYTGDGIMALFGAPIAHEDHAQRACFAALHLRQALRHYADELRVASGLNFSVRMGLNSGEVIVGRIGDDLRMDYTAQGHTVGLAARMEQLAEPGKVLLTQHTADLAAGYFRLRDLGAARVKGSGEPLRLYELEDVGEVRTRFDLSRQRGFSRFVGRVAESERLEAALRRALAGDGCAVGVSAQAGTGKSRLCHELAQRCRARGIEVYEGHAVAHGKMVPLLPVLELMRGIFGISPRDTAEAARQKIAGAIVLLDPGLHASLPLWFDFLGVPDPARPMPPLEPEVRQARLAEATRELIAARGRREARVLLLEDLHWLDDASEALLAGIVSALAGSRTLLLVNFRPEYRAAWAAGIAYDEIDLEPLGDEAVEELLDDLLGSEARLAPLRRLVHERTGGSPFFVEEVVRSLFDQGVLVRGSGGAAILAREIDELQIPPTVQAVLAARIDRLPEASKQVLQTAAVIGKSFEESILRSALEAEEAAAPLPSALAELVDADLLRLESLYPEASYAFFHPLTQEVAYRSQLVDRRVRVHAAVAHAIEAAHPGQLDEQAALLAHHWAGARQPLRAAEWLGPRDRRETMRHWRQVLELLAPLPLSDEVAGLGTVARQRLLVHGVFAGISAAEVESLFRDGVPVAESLPTRVPLLLLRMSYGLTRMFSGAIAESLSQMRVVLRLAEESGDRMLRYVARVSMLATLIHSGHLLECLECSEEAEALSGGDVNLAAEMTRFSPFGVLLSNRAQALMYLGRTAEVWPALERASEIGRERNDNELLSMARVFRAQTSEIVGDAEGALRYAQEAVEVSERADSPQLRVGAYGARSIALLANECFEEAIEVLMVVLRIARETGTGLFLEVPRLVSLAEARLGLGDVPGARRDLEQAIALARERGAYLALGWALVIHAKALRLDGEVDAAAASLDAAAENLAATSARVFEPELHLERAALAERRGDEPARQREVALAREGYTAIGAVGRLARLPQWSGAPRFAPPRQAKISVE